MGKKWCTDYNVSLDNPNTLYHKIQLIIYAGNPQPIPPPPPPPPHPHSTPPAPTELAKSRNFLRGYIITALSPLHQPYTSPIPTLYYTKTRTRTRVFIDQRHGSKNYTKTLTNHIFHGTILKILFFVFGNKEFSLFLLVFYCRLFLPTSFLVYVS